MFITEYDHTGKRVRTVPHILKHNCANYRIPQSTSKVKIVITEDEFGTRNELSDESESESDEDSESEIPSKRAKLSETGQDECGIYETQSPAEGEIPNTIAKLE